MATATTPTRAATPAPSRGSRLPLGVKPWQLGLIALTLAVVGYYIYKRSQSSSTSTTTPSSAVDTSGATSGQPNENAVPPPSVTYNVYPPGTAPQPGAGGSGTPGQAGNPPAAGTFTDWGAISSWAGGGGRLGTFSGDFAAAVPSAPSFVRSGPGWGAITGSRFGKAGG